jgi:hypothetical protein
MRFPLTAVVGVTAVVASMTGAGAGEVTTVAVEGAVATVVGVGTGVGAITGAVVVVGVITEGAGAFLQSVTVTDCMFEYFSPPFDDTARIWYWYSPTPAGNAVEVSVVPVFPVAICGQPVPPGERREIVYDAAPLEEVQLSATCGAPLTHENAGVF